jgi:hypothetical protein
MVSRFVRRYVEYRRVGLNRPAAMRLAWMVALAGVVPVESIQPPIR